jgi:hypothetical protein
MSKKPEYLVIKIKQQSFFSWLVKQDCGYGKFKTKKEAILKINELPNNNNYIIVEVY